LRGDPRFKIEQVGGQLHRANAIGEYVMHLHHERSLPLVEAFDEGELPQRPRAIKSLRRRRTSEFEHLGAASWRRKRDAAQVIRQIEI
jgi:hypothetical protein